MVQIINELNEAEQTSPDQTIQQEAGLTAFKIEEQKYLIQKLQAEARLTVLKEEKQKLLNKKIQAEARMSVLKEEEQKLLNQKIRLENEKCLYATANEKVNFYLAIEKNPSLMPHFMDLL